MIYLFNQTEELIDVIDEASLAEFTHTIELNQFDRASFEIPVDYKPNIIKEAQFFGFQSRDRAFCLFRISEKSYDIGLTIQGIDRSESDLHSFIIEDKRPGGTASDVLREILKGTGYQLGDIDGLTINGNMSLYYISVRQALVKLIESYACEFRVRYTFAENKIIGRYIDLNQRFGRKTGHQFEYGSNILNITYEDSSDEVVTALIGRGKGEQSTDESGEATGGYGRRIQFKDVVWSISKGDPVDKPAGQNYVSNEAARNIYGLHQNGVIKHRFGVYTNEDIEDPVELLKATYKELQRLSVPIVTFKANLLDLSNAIEQDIWIGDSVAIVRDQIGIAFEARIHKLVIDKLSDNRSVVELGDYQTLQAKDRSTRQQALQDAIGGFSESSIRQAIVTEVERRDKEFDEKIRVNKLEFDNELQRAKEKAEEIKHQISSEIDKKFQSFDNASIQEARRKAEEALRNAGASSLLAQEAKRISDQAKSEIDNLRTSSQTAIEQIEAFKSQYGTKLNEVKSTADGLFTKMGAVETYISKDGQRQESLQRYARDESARQVSAIREQISRDYVGKSAYQEDVRGLERRFSAISTQTNNDIATKIAQYKQTVDGRFANLTYQIAGKVNQTDFQRVRETSQLYERIIGSNENDISNKVARMALTSQLFQVEVSKNEVLKTVQRQIAGSWSVQNINSAGDLISGINLGANGQNRIAGKLTHITGETLIDKAVIKSAMIDKLKTANFEAGSVTTTILDAEAVTADKLRVDQALFNKLVANEAYLSLLFAKQAFINRIRSISIDASQITTGTLSGDRIYGGTISGTTLTGHTRINLGEYGSFDTVNGGLQINVPRTVNSKDGLGVQFIGSSGRGENVPYGLFVYKDDDITRGDTARDTDEFIMTVQGYINTKGIGWLKTGKGKVGSVTTGTLGFWQSTVALDYAPNDIYYTYNGTAYGLWAIIKQTFSDSRLKENIVDCKHKALDYIQQFQFKEYDWKKQEDRPQQAHTKIGLIAQEVQAVDPTLVYENGDTLNLDNLRLTTMALKAIQELNQRLEKLEKIA
nr:MAG TPA: tail protein [Caudoviricetes sp.]